MYTHGMSASGTCMRKSGRERLPHTKPSKLTTTAQPMSRSNPTGHPTPLLLPRTLESVLPPPCNKLYLDGFTPTALLAKYRLPLDG